MGTEKKKTARVKPQVLKGFRDYIPAEEMARQKMLAKVRQQFELLGFQPLQTPSLEFASTLLGSHYNEDSLKELFGFTGPDDVDMALRYEFTVSLARYVASDPNIALPFRRYQFGNCWRVDKPGPGRFREFMQFDIDIVGAKNILADSEIIAAMVTTFEHLDIDNFQVRYSNRKILNGLIEHVGIASERGQDVMRVIDKLDKQGREAVLLELGPGRRDKSGDKIDGVGLPDDQIKGIEQFLDIANSKGPEGLSKAEEMLGAVPMAQEGIDELKSIDRNLEAMGVNRHRTEVDLTIVRGLGYYTGPVFETTLLDLPEYGSVFSGGRYDNLVSRFSSQPMPGVGASIGPDRLLAALIALEKVQLEQSVSKVLVTIMDREHTSDYLNLVSEIRNEGIPCEIFAGDTKNLTKQIKYGDKAGIPFAVIIGSDEFERGDVTVKNLEAGRAKAAQTSDRQEWLKAEDIQVTIPRQKLLKYLKDNLNKQ